MRKILTIMLFAVVMNSLPLFAAEPVDYVDPYIGSIGHLLRATTPTVQLPNKMARVAPVTTPGIKDVYLADKIYGFPANASLVTAVTGEVSTERAKNASAFDHDFETATPYWYSVLLEDYDITADATVSDHCAFYRFTFPSSADRKAVVFSLGRESELDIAGDSVIKGSELSNGIRCYFYALADRPCRTFASWAESEARENMRRATGSDIGAYFEFSGESPVEFRIGFSYISLDQAKKNLDKELAGKDFDTVKSSARKEWNKVLGRIEVEGGTEKQRRKFYTALYRVHGRMIDITENGRYFSGFDMQEHDSGGIDFYTDDWLWDTYRAMHPLQLILDPEQKRDMVSSYVRMYEQSAWLPLFPGLGGDRPVMIGHHATAMIVDSWMKGVRDFDVATAYEAMKKNAMEATMLPWNVGPKTELTDVYLEKGFFPAKPPEREEWVAKVHSFERRQAVAVTLEHAYDDWCLALMAKDLGKTDDYNYFMRRARNYENVYNKETGFMSPRTADGAWITPFDPKLSGGQGGRAYFAECNSWVYTWHVQHDVAGLINLMGGRETFVECLDRLFAEQPPNYHFQFLGQFPDATGLTGLMPMGDEPAFHIPYMYNYAGEPWKAQRRLRELMKVWFDDDPYGIPGDEDGGAMSAWYVMSAMGFYPVAPGRPVYDIGSPIFEKITIYPNGGKPFTIIAENSSVQNKYIQSASINGTSLDKPYFSHDVIANGGTLKLEMGPRPNKTWGAAPEKAPPSMSMELR